MAQHSHSVYGNVYPFQYQKNRGNNHPIIYRNVNNGKCNNVSKAINNELLSKNNIFKSTEILNRSGRLPFSDRNGKLHRSNPHIHFGGLKLSEPNSGRDSGSSNFFGSKPNYPSPPKTPSKWKSEISNAANFLPRKWCDFVFRRNNDNKLYRSESFRFIQKTNSLLPPLSAGLDKYRSKKLEVLEVSADYVEPLDHVVSAAPSSQGFNNKSTSFRAGLISPPANNEDQDVGGGDDADDAAAYNEIIENYNAPYYYSDTIKQEPTYCSPCTTWNHHSKSCVNLSSSVENHTQSPLHHSPTITTLSSQQHGNSHCQQHRVVAGESVPLQNTPEPPSQPPPSSGRVHMARKRYETAFLPSSSHHPPQPSSPDVDYLLLGIESSCSLVDDHTNQREDNYHVYLEGNNSKGLPTEGWRRVAPPDSSLQLEPDPSKSYRQSSNHSHQNHFSVPQCGSATSNSSPFSDKKPKPNMPLSEPLPQKKYVNNNNNHNSSSSCSSSSPSTSASLTSCRPSDKRLLLTMMKDNSVSSLESIDSTKSEDLNTFSRPFGSHRGGGSHNSGPFGRGGNCKLLSPISDKSPLEPISMLQQSSSSGGGGGNDTHLQPPNHYHHHDHHHLHDNPWPGHHHHVINTAELTNVPWDMPKIRRRLALLADSGISLDSSGNTQSESGQFCCSSDDRRSFDDTNFQYTTRTHIRGSSDLRVTGDSLDLSSGRESGRNSRVHNLQLNIDNGMMVDEYYEDPRLNVTEQVDPISKPRLPWMTNITSVQVHEADLPPQPPPKPDRCRMKLDFGSARTIPSNRYEIDPSIELEGQEWFHGAITRSEAEAILRGGPDRATKEGSFLVRNCESSSFNRYSLSLKSIRGYIHIRIEPNSLGSFSLGEQDFPSIPHLVLHFMYHRLPIKGAEHVKLMYPVITQLL